LTEQIPILGQFGLIPIESDPSSAHIWRNGPSIGKTIEVSFVQGAECIVLRRYARDHSLVYCVFTPHRVNSRRPHQSSSRLNLGPSKAQAQAQHHSIRSHFGHSAMVPYPLHPLFLALSILVRQASSNPSCRSDKIPLNLFPRRW
jgi:hypothetical protein